MFRKSLLILGAVAVAGMMTAGAQERMVMVGGAAMYPSKDIVDNAVNSKDHTTLVAAVKAAGLVQTLKGAGPFTVSPRRTRRSRSCRRERSTRC